MKQDYLYLLVNDILYPLCFFLANSSKKFAKEAIASPLSKLGIHKSYLCNLS